MTTASGAPSQLWISLAVLALVVVRFLFRELRPRRIPVGRMYVIPAVVGALACWLLYWAFSVSGETGIIIPGTIAALAVGAGIGWLVARYSAVSAEPGVTIVRGSYATVAIWLGALALRYIGRLAVGSPTSKASLALNAVLVVMIAAALFVSRYEFASRARALRG